MGIIQAVLGSVMTFVSLALFFAGIHKLYTISSDLHEIKELLKRRDLADSQK